jgi:MFS family permease
MAFGILEDHRTPMPMGTVVLDDVFGAAQHLDPDDPQFSYLKKEGHIVLQPQPSDSPNDPLNWSDRHKYWLAILLMVAMTTVGATHGMLTTGYRIIAETYHTDFPSVVERMTPPYVTAHAISLFLASATAAVYGKRVQFVCAITVVWLCMLTGWFANSLEYYLGLRVVEGLAAGPMDLLMAPVITDMIYVHKRGKLMALQALVHILGGDARYVLSAVLEDNY